MPKLYQALITGERLSKVTIDLYRISGSGAEEKYFTIELEGAFIASIEASMPGSLESDLIPLGPGEQLTFGYNRITWTYVPDGVAASDELVLSRRQPGQSAE